MPQEIFTSQQDSERGALRTITAFGGSTVVFLPREVANNQNYGNAATALNFALSTAATEIATESKDGLSGKYLETAIQRHLKSPLDLHRKYIVAVRKSSEDLAARKARLLAVQPGNETFRATLATRFLSIAAADRAKIAMDSELELASVIYRLGQSIAGIEPRIWTQFALHYMTLNGMYISGLQANHSIGITPASLTRTGPDTNAAYKVAAASIADIERIESGFELAEQYA